MPFGISYNHLSCVKDLQCVCVGFDRIVFLTVMEYEIELSKFKKVKSKNKYC